MIALKLYLSRKCRANLPETAIQWLKSRTLLMLDCLYKLQTSFPMRTGVLKIPSLACLDHQIDSNPEKEAQINLQAFAESPTLLLDIAAPFICGEDLIRLYNNLPLNGNQALYAGQYPVAVINSTPTGQILPPLLLPEFRSGYVIDIPTYNSALEIHKHWPFYFYNADYKKYWERILHKNSEIDPAADWIDTNIDASHPRSWGERKKDMLFFLTWPLPEKNQLHCLC